METQQRANPVVKADETRLGDSERRVLQRFMQKVIMSNGCWEWASHIDPAGYGRFWLRGKAVRAHRVSWELHNGHISSGMKVLHRCDNRKCVCPEHLFLGTSAENSKDMVSKGRQAIGENNGASKLSASDVGVIREVRGSTRAIAKRFGVSAPLISKIRANALWNHI